VVAGPFFCEAFAITRWIPGLGFKPKLTLRNVAVVVPSDSGLPCAFSEREYLLSLAQNGRQVTGIPARFLDLYDALASGEHDGWHFTGHGGYRASDPNRSVIYLEDQETFTPEQLVGVVTNLGVSRPLVFLNACQIGRGGMSLTDIGGWAKQFLFAGAGAFIGPYWSVYDQSACDFAQEVYSRLLAGLPIGKAVQEARLAIRNTGDLTWLAYTVFADPFATVREGASSTG
jgi:CHAT domain